MNSRGMSCNTGGGSVRGRSQGGSGGVDEGSAAVPNCGVSSHGATVAELEKPFHLCRKWRIVTVWCIFADGTK